VSKWGGIHVTHNSFTCGMTHWRMTVCNIWAPWNERLYMSVFAATAYCAKDANKDAIFASRCEMEQSVWGARNVRSWVRCSRAWHEMQQSVTSRVGDGGVGEQSRVMCGECVCMCVFGRGDKRGGSRMLGGRGGGHVTEKWGDGFDVLCHVGGHGVDVHAR